MDGVPVADGLVKPTQDDEAAPLGWDQAIRIAVEWTRPAAFAQGAEGGEAKMDAQIVRAVHRTGQHDVRVPIVQSIAGQLDRVQTARARGVDRRCAGLEV